VNPIGSELVNIYGIARAAKGKEELAMLSRMSRKRFALLRWYGAN
jgi:hypothetical protein